MGQGDNATGKERHFHGFHPGPRRDGTRSLPPSLWPSPTHLPAQGARPSHAQLGRSEGVGLQGRAEMIAVNMRPGKSPARPAGLPACLPVTLLGSLAQKAPPSRGVRNKSCLQEAHGQTSQGLESRLPDSTRVRTEPCRSGAGDKGPVGLRAPKGSWGCGLGPREGDKREPRGNSRGGARDREKRRDQEETGFNSVEQMSTESVSQARPGRGPGSGGDMIRL